LFIFLKSKYHLSKLKFKIYLHCALKNVGSNYFRTINVFYLCFDEFEFYYRFYDMGFIIMLIESLYLLIYFDNIFKLNRFDFKDNIIKLNINQINILLLIKKQLFKKKKLSYFN
jgi:hypothetical protein